MFGGPGGGAVTKVPTLVGRNGGAKQSVVFDTKKERLAPPYRRKIPLPPGLRVLGYSSFVQGLGENEIYLPGPRN